MKFSSVSNTKSSTDSETAARMKRLSAEFGL